MSASDFPSFPPPIQLAVTGGQAETPTPAEASDCVDRFHGQDFNGTTLSVSMNIVRTFAPLKIAEPKKRRSRK